MTKEQISLNSLLKYWQEILALSHWSISVKPVVKLEEDGQRGHIEYMNTERSAIISILNKRSLSRLRKKEPLYTESQENILVHELLHLLTQNVKEGEDSEETFINSLTRSLLLLKERTTSGAV